MAIAAAVTAASMELVRSVGLLVGGYPSPGKSLSCGSTPDRAVRCFISAEGWVAVPVSRRARRQPFPLSRLRPAGLPQSPAAAATARRRYRATSPHRGPTAWFRVRESQLPVNEHRAQVSWLQHSRQRHRQRWFERLPFLLRQARSHLLPPSTCSTCCLPSERVSNGRASSELLAPSRWRLAPPHASRRTLFTFRRTGLA
jgi:hypothetical protein